MNSGNDTLAGGLPHSEIHGSKLAHSSPWLIAACHVLHRLCAPRHPPNALKTLDYSHYHCSFPTFRRSPAMMMTTKRPTIIRFTRPRTSIVSSSVGRSSLQDPHVHESTPATGETDHSSWRMPLGPIGRLRRHRANPFFTM